MDEEDTELTSSVGLVAIGIAFSLLFALIAYFTFDNSHENQNLAEYMQEHCTNNPSNCNIKF